MCEQLLHSEGESERQAALGVLETLRTPNAVALLESALQIAPSNDTRQTAALYLVLIGIGTGVPVLEKKLETLQPISPENGRVTPEYLLFATALAKMNNMCGLEALARLLEALEKHPSIDWLSPMNYLRPFTKQPPTPNFEDWKRAMEQWIREKRQGLSDN
jgi:hypothetical protein